MACNAEVYRTGSPILTPRLSILDVPALPSVRLYFGGVTMAEVLGITASIIAVIQLASQVATMSYSYIGRAKRASKEVSQLVGELNSLKEVLLILEKYIKDNPGSSVIQKLDRSIRGCSQDLEHLKGKLEPRKGIRQVMDRFKWPMMDGVIAKAQSRIERHKTLFLLALSVDQMLLAKKNEQNTKDTYHGIKTQYEDFWKKEKRIKVLDWLTNENFEKKHTEIRNKRQEGTGEWLLVDPEFEKWFIEGCSLLWGFGIPGAGKTFLSSAVIDHLHLQKKVIVAYIYFDYKEEEQQRPVHVLESLVKQLASQLPDLPKDLEALHDDLERERRRPTTDELNKVLLTIIDSSCGKMFLVFDALDECDQDGQRKELLSLLHFMAGYYSVFVTSRQHPEDIQESFQYSAKIRLSANEDDIKRYIEHKIDGNTRARRLVEQGNCRERIISELIGCASGMFLLAHFHIEHLCQQTTAKQILSALDQLRIPSTGKRPLDPTYDRAMNTMLNQPPSCADLGLMVLSWLVRSRRTLKTEELRLAVSVKQDRYELDELDLPDKATILDVCAGLVMADESGTIRLVHYTVQEYLTNNPTVSQDADFRIAMTCTTFLSFSIFAQDIPTPYSSPQSWIAYHPFLRYAATHLSSHLNACDENLTTDLVLKFISSPNCIDNYLRFLLRRRKNYNYQRLLMWECRKSTSQKLQPLHLASYLGHLPIVHSLLGQKESLPIHEPGMWTPLHFAAYEGWEKVVLLLLNYEADWSIGDRFGQTPLHIAASEGHKAVVEALLGKGADLSIKDFRGKTALDLTLKDRFVEVARVLLGRGAEPETTAIFDAAFDGQEAIVEVLLESGANITARDTKGDTVLHLAARGGYLSLVRLLLDKGAKSSAINRCGDTALHTAVLEGRKETVQLLLEGDAEAETTVLVLNDTGETALHNAALLGDERSVRILLDKGAKHSTPNNYRDTPLHNALSRGYGMIVEMLLDSGADSCDVSNCYGITPLQLAASKGNLTFVESFLVGGADLSKSDCYGDTALSFAAAMGHKEVVRLLLEKGADFSRQNKLGNTALHKAALRDHEEVVQLLLENGADWSIQNAYGDTVLHLAAGNGHVVVVELLLNSSGGVGLAAQNNGGDTALHQAASEGKYRVLEVLLEAGVDLSVVNNSESTALHYAAWGGHQVCLKLLLKWGFKPSAQDKHGNTALHTAARRGYTAIVETLLENGADTSVKNFDGDTALHYAAWKGYVPVVELLLKKGANPFVSNRLRNTPLHIAVSYENFVVGGILYEVLRARAREETVIRTQAE